MKLPSRKILFVSGVIAFVGVAVGWWCHVSPEDRAIEKRYAVWQSAMKNQQYAVAYAFMSPDYRGSNSVERFAEDFWFLGSLDFRMSPGRTLRVRGSRAWLFPVASHWYAPGSGPEYEWTKVQGQWFLTGKYVFYVD